MLKYNGNIIPNDIQIGQMNDLMGCLEFIEKIYYANITLSAHDKKPIVINDEKLVAQIKIIKESNQTNEEKNNLIDKTLRESGHLDINYQRRLFNSILLDFCLWMENSLKMIQEFKPQLAFALARKPLIDEIYYLQLLYLDPQCAVNTVFLNNAKDKEIQREKDEHLCKTICKDFGFEENNINELRYGKPFGIKNICNASLHIVTSRNSYKTESGELNFVFLEDDIIKKYTELYLNTLTPIMQYVFQLIFETELKLYEIDKESQLYFDIFDYIKKHKQEK